MKRFLISAIALAGLGGCATYDYAGGSAPGGYYSGSPRYEYSYPDGYYGGYGGAYGLGFSGYGGYGYGYGYSPGYYRRPIYVIRQQVRPYRGEHGNGHSDGHRPPRGADGGHRPPPGGWHSGHRGTSHPGSGRPRPSMVGGTPGHRPSSGRSRPPRAQAGGRAARPQSSRPRPSRPAMPRQSHFRNRPIRRER